MARSETVTYHINVTLSKNADSWQWADPRSEKSLSLTVPAGFFSVKQLGSMIEDLQKVVDADYLLAVATAKAEEEAARLQAEEDAKAQEEE